MTIIWLIVWILEETPVVTLFTEWNNWGVALLVCFAIDLLRLGKSD